MSATLASALLVLLGAAAWLDLRSRRIPNWIVAGVVLLWVAAIVAGDAVAPWPAAGLATLVLLVGIAVWRCGWLGGGDVKLIAALSLWAGPDHLASFLLAAALCGGLLALAILVGGRLAGSPLATLLRLHAGQLLPAVIGLQASAPPAAALPYGVAVALGGCWLVKLLLA
jgi:prepilin peptidase CpaA